MVSNKDKGTAYILLIVPSIFGIAGLHRFYIGQVGMGLIYLFTFGFLGIGLIIDLFTLGGMVDKYNLMQNALYGQQQTQAQPQNVVVNLSQNVAQNSAQPAYAAPPPPAVPMQAVPQQQQVQYPDQPNINSQLNALPQPTGLISISCQHCGQVYKNIKAQYKGRTVNCKKCQQAVTI